MIFFKKPIINSQFYSEELINQSQLFFGRLFQKVNRAFMSHSRLMISSSKFFRWFANPLPYQKAKELQRNFNF
jgi:hypothetical protein